MTSEHTAALRADAIEHDLSISQLSPYARQALHRETLRLRALAASRKDAPVVPIERGAIADAAAQLAEARQQIDHLAEQVNGLSVANAELGMLLLDRPHDRREVLREFAEAVLADIDAGRIEQAIERCDEARRLAETAREPSMAGRRGA